MHFKRDINWEDVFGEWREAESSNPGWIECATKIKGWPTWESWRRFSASQLRLEERNWKIFEFENPLEEVPKLLMGPYVGWQSRVERKNETTFEELLEIPQQYEYFKKHRGVLAIMEGLPFPTQLIGLIRKDINEIFCIEGHHRGTAMTLAKKMGREIDFKSAPVTIALAEIEDAAILDVVLERGTDKR